MKICKRGLYAQIIDEIGTVRACSWAGYYILGNLRDNTMSEVFNSEAAKKFRQTLLDGTYEFCNEENCPYMANGNLDTFMVEVDQIPEYPQLLSLAYDRRCNYHCTCCISSSNCNVDTSVHEKIEREIQTCLPYVKEFSANGLGEFFVSESMNRVVSQWRPEEIPDAEFVLETNGSLFTKENWRKIRNIGKANLKVAITVMSFDEMAYQYLSGTTYPIDRIVENLKFVKELRDQGIINYLEIATVVQERNFRTMPEFVHRCIEEFGADCVRLRRFLPEKAMDENIEWFFDIRNPRHPYHKEYLKVMDDPIFKDPHVFIWTGDHLSDRGEIPAAAGYKVMRDLMLIDNIGKKLSDYLIGKGYRKITLYATTDIGKALLKVLNGQEIEISPFILDRNNNSKEWNGLTIQKPMEKFMENFEDPILVTLVARHHEMEMFLRKRGYKGEVLSLENILEKIESLC